ncbi:O-antigen ligase family protein [Sporosarcina psychrophila]|uniref:O-antigen ligase family protein n=1 Tax=Sporosarcina psychrophila TaxID=1476 RepID=UPI00078B884B|nr:O-antigen ligase family protein [Sporosarcina psychrophila]AMQ07889.1 hypothetical protein AZE41_19185 [Sporosarcina psychrophila]
MQIKNSYFKYTIELAISLYFILGGLEKSEIFIIRYADYIISLCLQLVIIIYILTNKNLKLGGRILSLYAINLSIIVIILINFINLNVNSVDAVNRILPLISIFGVILIFSISSNKILDFNNVLKITVYGYFILGSLIILDAISFLFLHVSIWSPDYYLGIRFSGPFSDPNFLGLFYGALSIIIIFCDTLKVKHKKLIIIVFLINLIISLSWTSIALFIVSVFSGFFLRLKNLFVKQLTVVGLYFLIIYLYNQNYKEFEMLFLNIFSPILPFSINELVAKFLSLDYRFKAQIEAIQIVKDNLMGMGPGTLVSNIGRDTHNSYIGFLFELGLPGFILLLVSVKFRLRKYNKLVNILSTFVFLMSLTLNVHYTVVYPLLMLVLINRYYLEKEKA